MSHRRSEGDAVSSWAGEGIMGCHIFELNIYYEPLSGDGVGESPFQTVGLQV
jgi:hypothetical protein